MTHRKQLNPSSEVSEALLLAIATERKAFLHSLHIYLVGAGALFGLARVANQLNVAALSFFIGWPTTIISGVCGGVCLYSIYLLIHQRSNAFMSRPVSANTRNALLENPSVASLGQISQLKVADLCQLQVKS